MNEVDQKQLGQVFAQSQSNSEEIKNLRTDLNSFASSIRTSIENLGDRLNRVGRTDWTALGTWAAVVVGFVFGVGTPIIVGILSQVHDQEYRQTDRVKELDIKLQREFSLALETVSKAAETQRQFTDAVNTASKERHQSVTELIKEYDTRVTRMENLWDDERKLDGQELRQWRSRALTPKPPTP